MPRRRQRRRGEFRWMGIEKGMDIDKTFATELQSVYDVPEPLRGALKDNFAPKEAVRSLIYSPAFSTSDEFSPVSRECGVEGNAAGNYG